MSIEDITLAFEEYLETEGLDMCLDTDFFSQAENKYIDNDTRLAFQFFHAGFKVKESS